LPWLTIYIPENVLKNFSIWTQVQMSASICENLLICTEYRQFFWYFCLVGLSPGYLRTTQKNWNLN
jgi:hypothetical protein